MILKYGIIESIQQAFQNLGIEFKKTSQGFGIV